MSRQRTGRTYNSKWPYFHDAAQTYPTMFDKAHIGNGENGKVLSVPVTQILNLPNVGHVSHTLVWTELGLDDNIEIIISWEIDRIGAAIAQISPCGGVDINSVDPDQVGFKPVWDISLPRFYFQNLFRLPIWDTFNIAHNTPFGELVDVSDSQFVVGKNWWIMRCVGGEMQAWYNNRKLFTNPIPRPVWSLGRDGWGIDIVGIQEPYGSPYGSTGFTSTPPQPQMLVADFHWAPYNTPLT